MKIITLLGAALALSCATAAGAASLSPSRIACSCCMIFTYCWVIDEPPWVLPEVRLAKKARVVPRTSIPPCS